MSFDYRTVHNGRGYCFTLPSLGLPDPQGEWVAVVARIEREGLVGLPSTSSTSGSSNSTTNGTPRMRYSFGECATVDIEHEGAIWSLPLLGFSLRSNDGKSEVFTVRVRRVPLPTEGNASNSEGAQTSPVSSSPSTPSEGGQSEAAGSASKEPQPRYKNSTSVDIADLISKVSLAASPPSAPLFPSLLTRANTSATASTSATAAAAPRSTSPRRSSCSSGQRSRASSVSSHDGSNDEDYANDSDDCFNWPLDTGRYPPKSVIIEVSRQNARKRLAEFSGQRARDWERMISWMCGSYEQEANLQVNTAFHGRIRWMQYVDRLPARGDPVPSWAKVIDPRLGDPSYWCVDVEKQTCFHLVGIEDFFRRRFWPDLIDPKNGLPFQVVDNPRAKFAYKPSASERKGTRVRFQYHPAEPKTFQLTCKLPTRDPGVIKLISCPEEYACQPMAASAEASYILNHWKLIAEQNGKQYAAFEPLAENVDLMDPIAQQFLGLLAEYASVEGHHGRVLYSISSPLDKDKEADGLYWVGVRLRDGGARFRIKSNGASRSIRVPGQPAQYAQWGTLETLKPSSPTTPKELTLSMPIPEEGEHDIILRVADAPQGKYRRMEYALRPRGSTVAIKEEEWERFEVANERDGWVLSYFCNLGRLSFGRCKLLRPPPGTRSFSDS